MNAVLRPRVAMEPASDPTGRAALAAPAALAVHYREVRAQSEQLVAPLTPEDCQVQSMPDASPAKWHLAHTTWFFETFVLEPHEPGFRPHDARYRVLFNSYYQGVGAQYPRPHRGLITRPTLDEVLRWRAAVDERVLALLHRAPRGHDDGRIDALVTLGLHHEQQHQELLLTDLQHAWSYTPGVQAYPLPAALEQASPGAASAVRWLGFDGGLVEIGHDPAADGAFAFDNEGPRHRVWLEPYRLADRLVTQGEYLAFIDDGGYRRPELWLSLGWAWVESGRRTAPLYWHHGGDGEGDGEGGSGKSGGDGWWLHGLHGRTALQPAAPVGQLSYFEADAYARWAGARLPTEAEWEHAARRCGTPPGDARDAGGGRFRAEPASPVGAGAAPALQQLYGELWQWTASSYDPYPGFRTAPGAVGEYNGKFMCQQLVLRGSSCATPRGHARASYRNFFPPEAQWQFSGLRLARDGR